MLTGSGVGGFDEGGCPPPEGAWGAAQSPKRQPQEAQGWREVALPRWRVDHAAPRAVRCRPPVRSRPYCWNPARAPTARARRVTSAHWSRYLHGQRRRNRRLWRRLARTPKEWLGAQRRHRSRAGALPRRQFDHAALRVCATSPDMTLSLFELHLDCFVKASTNVSVQQPNA